MTLVDQKWMSNCEQRTGNPAPARLLMTVLLARAEAATNRYASMI